MVKKLYNLDIWIYNRIKFFHDKEMVFYESNESLAKRFDRHKNRISSSINKLLNLGYIENLAGNKFSRQIVLTKKELNINGVSFNKSSVSFNKSSVSFNNLSVKEITRMLKELNKSGVQNLTKAVLELNKNGDQYKDIIKIFNIDITNNQIRIIFM